MACVGSEEEGEGEVEEVGGPQRDEVAQTQGFSAGCRKRRSSRSEAGSCEVLSA